jgi:transposase
MGMMRDAIKSIEKTPEEINGIKGEIQKAGLPDETVAVLMYGLNLILWLPKLILEQKVTISRLKELLFGKKQRKAKPKADKSKPNNNETDSAENAEPASITAANDDDVIETASADVKALTEDKTSKGHGRTPHTAYTEAEDHQLTINDLKAGMPCPSKCNGRLYDFKPGIIIRIKGQ